jgi:hypothetical protein
VSKPCEAIVSLLMVNGIYKLARVNMVKCIY